MSMELFTANFTIDTINKDGRQFDDVSRIVCHSENRDAELTLDIATHVYQVAPGEVLGFVLTRQISQDPLNESQPWRPSYLTGSDAMKYEYVMYGKVYRYEEDSPHHKATVYVSFGGLLMSLTGEQNALREVSGARAVFLMIRKIQS
jgi:DNA-directed RNA polymerase I, II, and III subunit RPABC3